MFSNPVIRAIDVGYGNVKYITEDQSNGEMKSAMFPAIALPASKYEIGDSHLQRRQTITVPVNGKEFEVGPDIELVKMGLSESDHFHEKYCESDEYLALFRGALRYMNTNHIDCLVVGLPVRYLKTKREKLENLLSGNHQISEHDTVTVKKVIILAQPLGGLIDHIKRTRMFGTIKDKVNLLIDPGMGTLDWIATKGLKEMPGMSDSRPYGVRMFLQRIMEELSIKEKIDYTDIREIDNGLRKGYFELYGREYDLERFLNKAYDQIAPAMNALKTSIGDGRNISNIFLVGGGADYYQKPIRKTFPNHRVLIVEEPVFANVRGFQWAGRDYMKNQNTRAA